MTTVNEYTASQTAVDGSCKKNFRKGRAGAANIIPTTTGAAIATTKALPEYEVKFDGVAIRVPIPVSSLSDMTVVMDKDVTVEEVNEILQEEAKTDRYKYVIDTTYDPIVSQTL